MSDGTLTRRRFLTTVPAAAALFSRFRVARGAGSPNEKLQVAHIGLGKRASLLIVQEFNGEKLKPHCRSVAFCDPWDNAGLNSWGVPFAKRVRRDFADVPRFRDFRRMFDKMGKDIDAVVISGVTNMHYPAGMWAMNADKHVFMQKPLCVTVEECRKLAQTALERKRVSGWDSDEAAQHCWYRDFLDSTVLGDVQEVHLNLGGAHSGGKPFPRGNRPVPDTLDWDVWLNVFEAKPYAPAIHHVWGNVHNLSIGWLGNGFGPHAIGGHVPALQLAEPKTITLVKKEPAKTGQKGSYHCVVELAYPQRGNLGPCKLIAYCGEPHYGDPKQPFLAANMPAPEDMAPERRKTFTWKTQSLIKGSKATALCEYSGRSIRLLPEAKMRQALKAGQIPRKRQPWGGEPNRFLQWVKACKAGEVRGHVSNLVDRASPANELLCLVYLAIELAKPGKALEWDVAAMRVANDERANAFLRRPYRKGWGV